MKYSALESVEILNNNQLFDERENGVTHTSYETELMFYSCIKNGDVEKAVETMHMLFTNKIFAGKLSDDNLRQIKYWAVCCITLATRYAIQGGLDETYAYNYSDNCILTIDRMKDQQNVFNYLQDICVELTTLVMKSRNKNDYPYSIKKCFHYINVNLHNKLKVNDLATECGLSADYLSSLFRKCVGISISQYIRQQKLKEASEMLLNRKTCSEIAYLLNFCSESYFIKCFKEEYGITPKMFAQSNNLL